MKKHKLLSVVLLLVLLLAQAAPVFALTSTSLVNDDAGILTLEEQQSLEAQAAAIRDEYGMSVRILVVPSMNGAPDAYEYAKSLYNQYFAEADSGSNGMMMLMLSMSEREYALIANGEGNDVYTDYGKEELQNAFLSDFVNDDWVGGFDTYLSYADDYCYEYYVNGEAVDVEKGAGVSRILWLLALFGSPLIGGCAVWTMVQGMRTAKKQTHAEHYVHSEEGETMTFKDVSDDYLYSQTIVVPHPHFDDDHDGFDGGTTIDFDGFSGDSGDF